MKTAITLLTCDRPELVAQSIVPLIESAIAGRHHLFVADGSTSSKNEEAILKLGYPTAFTECNIRGGAGAAIVYALTRMLNHKENYDVVGLCEADVRLPHGWFEPTADLFVRGRADGLEVGAVSARCFADRVLFQRDQFAVCHNLGAGHVMFTRQAARLVLDNFRTAWTSDNRRIFAQLSGVDIGSFWAFRTNEHYLTGDWWWDAVLAAHGLASLALTPSPVEMIGQTPPLAEQGLEIVKDMETGRYDRVGFETYCTRLALIHDGARVCPVETRFHFDPNTGTWTYFPHQITMLGGHLSGDWRLLERRGWGTWAYEAGEQYRVNDFGVQVETIPSIALPAFGNVAVLVSGGKQGGKVEVTDTESGFTTRPDLPPEGDGGQVLQLQVPGAMSYRTIRITALTPGVCFHGMQSRDKQVTLPDVGFDHSMLPGA